MSKGQHPVWALYDMLRTARLNEKYYEKRLAILERNSNICEFVLLASAPTSAIAGMFFWQTDIGSVLWRIFAVVAAVTSIAKPLVFQPKMFKALEVVVYGYRMLSYDLIQLKDEVETTGAYDASIQKEFGKARKRERDLVEKKPERCECKKLLDECTVAVLNEFPEENFFTPEV